MNVVDEALNVRVLDAVAPDVVAPTDGLVGNLLQEATRAGSMLGTFCLILGKTTCEFCLLLMENSWKYRCSRKLKITD